MMFFSSPPAISIHALREEGDAAKIRGLLDTAKFLSTPSARRATECHRPIRYSRSISIHALREEGDGYQHIDISMRKRFLSTPSARRATGRSVYACT